ncbi:MAG: MCE family protein [Verrucomicrobiota bacterium]|nr:MCE family protein [Verrucomicrobiota bacterium]
MTDQLKNILIGLFVVAAITVGVSMILFLEPTVGDGKKILHVRFSNVAGINIGTRVTFAGKPVGEVAAIQVVPDARENPPEQGGTLYVYELTLKLDSKVKVYTTDEISIRSTGLMGERSITIIPRVPPDDQKLELITNQILYAKSGDLLETAMNKLTSVADQVGKAVQDVDDWFNQNKDNLSSAVKSFDGAMNQVEIAVQSVNDEKLIPAVKQSVELFSDDLRLIRSALDDDQLLHKIANLVDDIDEAFVGFNADGLATFKNLNIITRDIATGSGTLGRLIVSDDFYLRLSSILGKVDTLMNDINHYGVLFQYDKTWQKSRTKRANLLKSLDSPSEFRTYFEGEVDTIQTALGRLTELLDRAQDCDERDRIIQSEPFKRDFASLLRQVQGLADCIKLYNEELVVDTKP